ncbi:hypothetical protein GGX14DRAFT_558129 [Mycena pura]|uniref:Uncharacterized protein n=1 Tax=Mycena pura TaxID=153505 RepID=A0AAD6YMD3_9AGAR|nr:hypothetical protein GGX14DRAFT_558129 [Mycena pura]
MFPDPVFMSKSGLSLWLLPLYPICHLEFSSSRLRQLCGILSVPVTIDCVERHFVVLIPPPFPRLVEPDVYIPTLPQSMTIDFTNFNEGLDESVFSGSLFHHQCALDAARHPSNPQIHPSETLRPQDLSLQSVESIFAELHEACHGVTPPSDNPLAPSPCKLFVPNDVVDTPPTSPSPLVPPRTKKRQKKDASAAAAAIAQKATANVAVPTAVYGVEQENLHAHSDRNCDTNSQ